jgi:hypothetical protein
MHLTLRDYAARTEALGKKWMRTSVPGWTGFDIYNALRNTLSRLVR